MTPIAEHKCELLLESGFQILKFFNNGWCFNILTYFLDEYRIFDINNCPYCGEELE